MWPCTGAQYEYACASESQNFQIFNRVVVCLPIDDHDINVVLRP